MWEWFCYLLYRTFHLELQWHIIGTKTNLRSIPKIVTRYFHLSTRGLYRVANLCVTDPCITQWDNSKHFLGICSEITGDSWNLKWVINSFIYFLLCITNFSWHLRMDHNQNFSLWYWPNYCIYAIILSYFKIDVVKCPSNSLPCNYGWKSYYLVFPK